MENILAFDEVDPGCVHVIDDEIGLFWDDDEVEDKVKLDYPPEMYKHLIILK